jgi:pimeloyl-ACP methyl ester carboxylesterase
VTQARGVFIGPNDRRSFVWEHRPEQAAPLAIVICPPLGYAYTCAYRTLRRLAEQLARRGHVVARLEYHGTSNAPGGHLDPHLVDAWRASVADTVNFVLAHGAVSVGLVGIGFGAMLAMQYASTDRNVSHLVLWDPAVSGRRYARELAALAMATGEAQPADADPAAISVIGNRYTPETLDDMKKLDATRIELSDRSILLVERPERDPLDSLADSLRDAQCEVTTRRIEGTAELLDTDAELARVPVRINDEIVRWISAASVETPPLANEPRADTSATTDCRIDSACEETYERIGPADLAVLWGRHPQRTDPTCVMFLNNGVAPSTGPARAWVDMSRALNRRGWGTMRIDLSGLGESPTRAGFHDDDTHARIVTDDISEAVDAARANGYTQFILVGLCSGAYNAVEAQYVDARITSSFTINPALWVTPRRRMCWFAPWWRVFEFGMRKTPVRVRVLRLPRWLFLTMARLHITPAGDQTIRHVARLGRRMTIVFSDDDAGLVDFDRRALRRTEDYKPPGSTVEVVVVSNLDHSLFGYGARETVTALLLEWMEQWRRDRTEGSSAADADRESFGQ